MWTTEWFLLQVEVASALDVVNLKSNFDDIENCARSGLIIRSTTSPGSGYDIFSLYFCPKLGINEVIPINGVFSYLLSSI